MCIGEQGNGRERPSPSSSQSVALSALQAPRSMVFSPIMGCSSTLLHDWVRIRSFSSLAPAVTTSTFHSMLQCFSLCLFSHFSKGHRMGTTAMPRALGPHLEHTLLQPCTGSPHPHVQLQLHRQPFSKAAVFPYLAKLFSWLVMWLSGRAPTLQAQGPGFNTSIKN